MRIFSVASFLLSCAMAARAGVVYDCYTPVKGGWEIHLTGDAAAPRGDPAKTIGVVSANAGYSGDPRLHRRPLFPPCDRSMLFSSAELEKLERCPFRPIVIAYNEPRFLFDYHCAGGLLGHLMIGLTTPGGAAKWFHQWSEITIRYVDGRMEYEVRDDAFAGVTVHLTATALSDSAGLLVQLTLDGIEEGTSLVWMYGGASAFFTNWAMTAPEFSFSPNQCAKDRVRWTDGTFALTRAFDVDDVIMKEVFAVARRLPDWKAVIRGGCSWKGQAGAGDPNAVLASPAALAQAATWTPADEQANCVAVYKADLPAPHAEGFIVVGMGGNIEDAIAKPEAALKAALERNQSIAERIVTETPDPYLDATMPMMAFATEGMWADQAYVHGGWSWRFAYLGWRILYGPDCYGWTDRVEKTLRNHARLNVVKAGPDQGALGSMLEYDPGVFYNMNEVFTDHIRHHLDYTDNVDLMRELYPIIEGVLQWEDRRLRPGPEPLYENALNTWISDQHWYIRAQCTQASAYMANANLMMAIWAKRLGKDPAPFLQKFQAISKAMLDKLWMRRAGVFAESLDTLGAQLLHPEPELPTIYHSAEFGQGNPYTMVYWAHTHLGQVTTPNGGKLYWSSNWYPNMARSYTHSTYEMAYAEELNFALTHYRAGLSDDAYDIIRACLCGIFNGPTPGGLSCHSYVDGRQRANDEFADAISMWGRTITEGLFGIVPHKPDGIIKLSPQFPSDWPKASIRTPHFSYTWERTTDAVSIEWSAPAATVVRLGLPIGLREVDSVAVDGQVTDHSLAPDIGFRWLMLDTPKEDRGHIEIHFKTGTEGPEAAWPVRAIEKIRTLPPVTQGDTITGPEISNTDTYLDPQGLFSGLGPEKGASQATVVGEPGPGLFYIQNAMGALEAVALTIRPKTETKPKVWAPPNVPANDLNYWTPLDLRPLFNAAVPEVMDRVHDAVKPPPAPASEINTAYYKDHLVPPFVSPKPSDEAWRKKVGADGLAWTTDGIPFLSAKEGPNIAVVTRAAVFPQALKFSVDKAGKTLYLMIGGTTFAIQSGVPNLRITLRYQDNTTESIDLLNPTGIGDCWNQYRYNDTAANGFENIGGRSGPAGSKEVADMTKPIAVDTEAHLVAFDLKPGVPLEEVQFEAVANDVIFGLMGATILR